MNLSVLIGAPRLQSNLYDRVERSGAIFHCFWKETDPNNEVLCTETNISKGVFKNTTRFCNEAVAHPGIYFGGRLNIMYCVRKKTIVINHILILMIGTIFSKN